MAALPYRHTQSSPKLPILMMVIAVGIVPPALFWHAHGYPWIRMSPLLAVMFIPLALGWIFRCLTVEVDAHRVWFGFGPGIMGATVPISDITECRAVVSPWWHGFGIHYIPRVAILYNIAGPDAVEIRRRMGRTIRIGTDQPKELARAIQEALAHPAQRPIDNSDFIH